MPSARASEASLGDHLDATLTPHVDLRVATDLGADGIWVMPDDVTLARLLSDVAHRHDVTSVPAEVTQLELALDTAHDGRLRRSGRRCSPAGRMPSCTTRSSTHRPIALDVVSGTSPHEVPRQRWHLDVWVAPEVADTRIPASVAAGGTVVDDQGVPSFTVLADPDGNKVCICTFLDRG